MPVRFRNVLLFFPLFMALAVFAVGCHKSAQKTAEENAIKEHEEQVKNQQKGFQQIHNLPSSKLISAAGGFLYGLNQKGELPGAETNTMIMSPPMTPDAPSNYPISVTYIQKPQLKNRLINRYTALKDSAESPWRLQKAWQTDASSNVVQEFPVQ